jgi:hypothetical protein
MRSSVAFRDVSRDTEQQVAKALCSGDGALLEGSSLLFLVDQDRLEIRTIRAPELLNKRATVRADLHGTLVDSLAVQLFQYQKFIVIHRLDRDRNSWWYTRALPSCIRAVKYRIDMLPFFGEGTAVEVAFPSGSTPASRR